jgi:hypothetical protein
MQQQREFWLLSNGQNTFGFGPGKTLKASNKVDIVGDKKYFH